MHRIVDATVIIKWLIPEQGSDRAAALMKQPLIAPDSVIPECVNALRKKVLRREISKDTALVAAHAVSQAGVLLESTQLLAEDILELSIRLSYPAYDCACLALARKVGGVVVTADQRLIARCRRPDSLDLAERVESLFDEPPMIQERPMRPYIARRKAA